MKLILLSGGSGKRLWPLSNESRSKQFLQVLPDGKGGMESMVQRVWRQLGHTALQYSTFITTGKAQKEMIYNQIGPEVPVIMEPDRRDTFSAIALSSVYLYNIEKVQLDEIVVVLPVDPFVEDRFFHRIKDLEQTLDSSGADLALIGIEPTFPSSKYGYIVPGKTLEGGCIEVSHFKEKPEAAQAEKLLGQKALWNAGVFAFKLGFMISMLAEKGFPIQYEELLRHYSLLPKQSFDYEVVEKAEKIVALPYNGYWKDLGTWNTLTEEMAVNQIGKGVISSDSKKTHLINELGIPVTVLGLENVIVAASPDGILVADKAESPRLKDMIAGMDKRPMFEERQWGWYRVLDYTKEDNGTEVLTKRMGIKAGQHLIYQKHENRNEVWTIIKGTGEFALDGHLRKVKAGDVLQIPVSTEYGIKAATDLEIIEVQTGSILVEEDVIPIYADWEDVVRHCNKIVS